ncbi:helix-turn-helix transcriptional regulator [archaeon]|nr:helix-turn-helix transcriptional regulator [archaeon]
MYLLEKEYERYIKDVGGAVVASTKPNQKIKDIRRSMNIRQEDLGTLMSLRRETISRIENGSISPTFAFLSKFSKLMALTKVIRDLEALSEIKMREGGVYMSNLKLLLFRLKVSPGDLEMISRLSEKGYQKSRAKILKNSMI